MLYDKDAFVQNLLNLCIEAILSELSPCIIYYYWPESKTLNTQMTTYCLIADTEINPQKQHDKILENEKKHLSIAGRQTVFLPARETAQVVSYELEMAKSNTRK